MELPVPGHLATRSSRRSAGTRCSGFKLLDATFPLSRRRRGAARRACTALRSDAEKAVHDGYHVLCISDKEACNRGIDPIPSLLALGAVHNYLCQPGAARPVLA